jgi:hypothetical protein
MRLLTVKHQKLQWQPSAFVKNKHNIISSTPNTIPSETAAQTSLVKVKDEYRSSFGNKRQFYLVSLTKTHIGPSSIYEMLSKNKMVTWLSPYCW